jgi:signal transduction histidine kinase
MGTSAPRFHAIRAANLRASVNEWIRMRPYRSAPSVLIVGALLWFAGYPVARIAGVVAAQLAVLGYVVFDALRSRRSPLDLRALFVSHLVILGGQIVVVALTGGLAGPMWCGIIGSTSGTLYALGRCRESTINLAVAAASIVLLALLPASIAGPPIARPFHVALVAWSMVFGLFMFRVSSYAVQDAHSQTGETLDRLREAVLESADARTQRIDRVGARVAHELKNPLSAVKGLAQLLVKGATEPRTIERLGVIGTEVERMEHILQEYLSFARPLDDLRLEAVDVGAVADDVVAVLEARAEAAGVLLARSSGRAIVDADPRRLKETLLNLAANALEATPRGGSVEIAFEIATGGVEVRVRDTGRGISAEDLARVGTPFFTTREGGTGLGVVLARCVIKQHGGELTYESEPGAGTTARFRLRSAPLRATSPPPAETEARAHG